MLTCIGFGFSVVGGVASGNFALRRGGPGAGLVAGWRRPLREGSEQQVEESANLRRGALLGRRGRGDRGRTVRGCYLLDHEPVLLSPEACAEYSWYVERTLET